MIDIQKTNIKFNNDFLYFQFFSFLNKFKIFQFCSSEKLKNLMINSTKRNLIKKRRRLIAKNKK